MSRSQRHRGPDSQGVFRDDKLNVALAHERLSIIDLSNDSAQPYHSSDERYVMIFNGEIYNFKQLARRFDLKTKTKGDTEVIIELFAKQGTSIFSEFNGMFSLAILDRKSGDIYLARDGRGIKPLYFFADDDNLVFGSEMRSICASKMKLTISKESLKNYFNLGFFPGDSTVYQEVKKLNPGYWISWNGGLKSENRFEQIIPSEQSDKLKNKNTAKEKFIELFQRAVQYRLIGDRPVGAFLSGGTDSSLVSYFANLDREVPINTYNIKIENAVFDESHYAQRIADIFHTNHHIIEINEELIKDEFVAIIDQLDEPFGDSSFIPTYILSQFVKKHITVSLSGDGGDELFMGYGYYQWPGRLNSFPFKYNKLWKGFFKNLKLSANKDHSKYFSFERPQDIPQHVFSQEQSFFSKNEISQLFKDEHFEYHIYDSSGLNQKFSDVGELQSFLDFKNYLPDNLLVKVDRASMLHSLEVRVPFLDKNVVDFAWNLHPSLKRRKKEGKILLKEVLSDYLPRDLVYRKKWGFSIPLDRWLFNEFDYLIDEIDDLTIQNCQIFNMDYIRKIISDFRSGKLYLYNKIWLLIIFFRWYKRQHSNSS